MVCARQQSESWERGYYRELARRKALEQVVEDLYWLIEILKGK